MTGRSFDRSPLRHIIAVAAAAHVLECGHSLPSGGSVALQRRRCWKCAYDYPIDTKEAA